MQIQKFSKINPLGFAIIFLLFSTWPVQGIFQVDDIKIEKYHLASSKVWTKRSNLRKRDVNVSNNKEFLFNLDLYNDGRPFTIYLRQRDSDILAEEATFLKIFNVSDIGYESIPMDFRKINHFYQGYITDNPNNSSVNGYLKEGNFYGHVIMNGTVYYVDELSRFKEYSNFDLPDGEVISGRNALIFKRDAVMIGMLLGQTKSAKELFQELVKQKYFYHTYRKWKRKGMLCPMVVIIDNSFLDKVHNFNVEAAIFQVLFSLEEANSNFRSTDFDGDGIPDNIGFYVKNLIVVTTNKETYFLPEYTPEIMPVGKYLVKLMRFIELPRHCLGMAFTAQKFDKGTLGASYTPDSMSLHPTSGICDQFTPNFGTLNGLVITASTARTNLISQIVFEVTISHELGHSFGAIHDNNQKCEGYLMSPKSFRDYRTQRNHVMFSPCSKEHIMRMLVLKGSCFEPARKPFCGNGIIEENEDCDCGMTIDCLQKDPCCVPRRTKDYPCKINRKKGYQCHPSQGECCTKECRYSTHLEKFVNCKNFEKSCPCPQNQTSCPCGLNGMCQGYQCHSIECARLQLTECSCLDPRNTKTCPVCCQYQDQCLPAMEVTNKLLSQKNRNVLKAVVVPKHHNFIYKTKQFVSNSFCDSEKCVNLPFSLGKYGGYCLYRGKLGKCDLGSKCQIIEPRQSFPSFESASSVQQTTLEVVNLICYFIFNRFLIYLAQ